MSKKEDQDNLPSVDTEIRRGDENERASGIVLTDEQQTKSFECSKVVTDSSRCWSIGVRTVTNSEQSASDFTVQVSPDDDLDQLYYEIENKTGLSVERQKLIYRGRLIDRNSDVIQSSSGTGPASPIIDSPSTVVSLMEPGQEKNPIIVKDPSSTNKSSKKIKDIAGLTDGHTIHLIERRIITKGSNTKVSPTALLNIGNNESTSNDSPNTPMTSTSPSPNNQEGTEPVVEDDDDSSAESIPRFANDVTTFEMVNGRVTQTDPPLESENVNNTDGDDDDDDDDDIAVAAAALRSSRPGVLSSGRTRWRARSASQVRRRHLSYRLSEEDLQVRDPGSLESVRQGLLTLHTLLTPIESATATLDNHSQLHNNARSPHLLPRSPLDVQRRFFQGQWIDVRDTVNQWLEATVVSVVLPEEILPPPMLSDRISHSGRSQKKFCNTPTTIPADDPAVSATDLEGRRKLLLEPCNEEDHEPNLGIELDRNGDPMFFRQREANQKNKVQLLLIHYNGWAHRWDEWIRSDSERIRPFRTRTRHPDSNPLMSPTIQCIYIESPCTNFIQEDSSRIEGGSEVADRNELLPELTRVMTTVNSLMSDVAALQCSVRAGRKNAAVSSESANNYLPWNTNVKKTDAKQCIKEVDDEENGDDDEEETKVSRNGNDLLSSCFENKAGPKRKNDKREWQIRKELELLAPLLDRLGRTLVDSAPHVAALAASLNQPDSDDEAVDEIHDSTPIGTQRSDPQPANTLGGFLSLLSRDNRRTSVGSSNAALVGNDNMSYATSQEQTTVASSTINREEEHTEDGSNNVEEESIQDVVIDPDYTDFATGLINTVRGDGHANARTNSRQTSNTSTGSTSEDLAGLLGAYLAAASFGGIVSSSDDDEGGDNSNGNANTTAQGLGRLLRDRGAGGNGIDIHIHAVVTTPGGNVGLATAGGGLAAALFQSQQAAASASRVGSSSTVPQQQEPQVLQQEDDDLGIFAELYSATPDPIDPSSPVQIPLRTQSFGSFATVEDNSSSGTPVVPEVAVPPVLFSTRSRRSGFHVSNDAFTNDGVSVDNLSATNNSTASPATPTDVVNTSRSSSTGSTTRHHRGGVFSRFFNRRS